ncbi:hypothetical protein [Flavobacterium sp. CAU 1735]|uniref:hypothetical protein n=1 Tax=Flavobacterium sp. CAU 1735 TaxID=3140361 RepID=UPI003261854C
MKKSFLLLCFIVCGFQKFSFIDRKIIQDNPFLFQKDNQKVVLEIENGAKHFNWDTKTSFTVKTENIDPRKLRLIAPGLRLLKGAHENNTESIWEITPQKALIKNDTLKVFVSVRNKDNSFWTHQFKILIK